MVKLAHIWLSQFFGSPVKFHFLRYPTMLMERLSRSVSFFSILGLNETQLFTLLLNPKQIGSQNGQFYPYLKRYWFIYWSPTKIPKCDKKTESPYLVHPLTYRQVYLTKDVYFVEKIHCELVEMAVGQRMNKIWRFGFLVTIRNFRRAPVVM